MFYLYHFEWHDIMWDYKTEKIEIAKSLGYKSIMECIVKEYWRTNSRSASSLFGCTRTWATQILNKYRFPVRQRGGVRYYLKDMSGEKFGKLLILKPTKSNGCVIKEYEVQCDCGTTFKTSPYFRVRNIESCTVCKRKIKKEGKSYAQAS